MFHVGRFGRLPPLSQVLSPIGQVNEMQQQSTEEAAEFVGGRATGISPQAVGQASTTRPQFSVKAKGVEGYVGSAWLNEGKFGRYISVKLHGQVGPSATLYISPTRENAAIL